MFSRSVMVLVLICGMTFRPAVLPAEKLTMEESVAIALENNPMMRVARENTRRADAVVAETTAVGMPKVSLEGTYTRIDQVPVVNFGGSEIALGSIDTRTADLVVVQPVDVFGAIRTGRESAKLTRSVASHEHDQFANDITLETKQAYFRVLREQKRMAVNEAAIMLLETHLKDTQARYDAGVTARFEVLRAETEIANAGQELIAAKNRVALAKAAFNNVLGRELDAPVELIEPDEPSVIRVKLADCTDSAQQWRPEALRAQEHIQISETLTRAARLSGMPRVNVMWAYNHNLDPSMLNPRDSSWRAFLTTSISLFDGGATRASVSKASSDEKNARSMYERVMQDITLETQQSHLSLEESRERIRAAEKGVEQARESTRLAQVRYAGGVSTQVEIMDAQAALVLSETNYINAVYDYQIALARLERAVGGPTHMAKLIEQSQDRMIAGAEE